MHDTLTEDQLETGAERNPELYATDEEISDLEARAKPKRKRAKPSPAQPARKHKPAAKRAAKTYSRKCADEKCGKAFKTHDPRQRYHSLRCGNRVRGKRWWKAAAEALRRLRAQQKKAPPVIRLKHPKRKAKAQKRKHAQRSKRQPAKKE